MSAKTEADDTQKKSNGQTHANGLQKGQSFDQLLSSKQKLLLAEKTARQNESKVDDINLNNNNIEYHNNETESYGDAFTHASTQHSKFSSIQTKRATKFLSDNNNDEPLQVFDGSQTSSFVHTVQDQFAGALLRLQTSLDKTDQRIASLEKRLNEFARQIAQRQQQSSSRNSSKIPLAKHLPTLAYLGWPILVYLTMKAMERRSVAAKY